MAESGQSLIDDVGLVVNSLDFSCIFVLDLVRASSEGKESKAEE